jgi:hypothetical protein
MGAAVVEISADGIEAGVQQIRQGKGGDVVDEERFVSPEGVELEVVPQAQEQADHQYGEQGVSKHTSVLQFHGARQRQRRV